MLKEENEEKKGIPDKIKIRMLNPPPYPKIVRELYNEKIFCYLTPSLKKFYQEKLYKIGMTWSQALRMSLPLFFKDRERLNPKFDDSQKGWTKQEWIERFGSDPYHSKQNFYRCTEWGKIRSEVLKRDDRTCQVCSKKPANHVHHDNDPFYFPMLALDLDNLSIFCKECHTRYHER